MAIAERRLAARVQPPRPRRSSTTGPTRICSDGDLQEGIASEAAALAGHLRLGKLVVALRRQPHPARRPDDDGLVGGRPRRGSRPTAGTPSGSRTATTSRRSHAAIEAARADDRPSLIAVRTHIGYRQPEPPGHPEGARPAARRRTRSGSTRRPTAGIRTRRSTSRTRRASSSGGRSRPATTLVEAWERAFEAYADDHPDVAAEFRRRVIDGRLPDGWDAGLQTYADGVEVATRNASQDAIQALAEAAPASCSAARPTCPSRT